MGDYHYWKFLRCRVCAALAILVIAVACVGFPALAAQSTGGAALERTKAGVSEALLTSPIKTPSLSVNPVALSNAQTSGFAAFSGVSLNEEEIEALMAIEPGAGLILAADEELYELLLSVQKKKYNLSDALITYQKGFTAYIPVQKLAELIKFPTTLSNDRTQIYGYMGAPENDFTIDIKEGTYTLKGQSTPLPEGSFLTAEEIEASPDTENNDLYLTIDALNAIWNLEAQTNISDLTLYINTLRKLPFEQEILRKEQQERLAKQEDSTSQLDLIDIPSGYQLLAPHQFRLSNSIQWQEKRDQSLKNTLRVNGRGDILGMESDYNFSIDTTKQDKFDPKNLRLKLTREGFGNDKTLPFGIKKLELGDISTQTSPLVNGTIRGRGAYISNIRNQTPTRFGLTDVTGTTKPGWDIEIYRGQTLMDYGTADDAGAYIFKDIPIIFGNNNIRIISYGPSGEVETETRNINIGKNTLKPGEFSYEVGAIDNRKVLIDIDDRNTENRRSGTAAFARIDTGITHWASGFATFTRLPTSNGLQSYLSAGANANILNGRSRLEAVKQMHGGSALEAEYATSIKDTNLTVGGKISDNFESPGNGTGDNTETSSIYGSFARLITLPFASLNISGRATHTQYENADSTTQFSSSQSLVVDNTNLSHNLTNTVIGNEILRSDGTISARQNINENWSASLDLDYDIKPETELDRTRLDIRYRNDNSFQANAVITKGLKDEYNQTTLEANASYDFGSFVGGTSAAWNEIDGLSLTLRANTSLQPDPKTGEYHFTTRRNNDAFATGLGVRLFEDLNNDGVFNEGDQPVSDSRIIVGKKKSAFSDENGIIKIAGAGPPGQYNVTLDRDHLVNPFLVPAKDGYSVILRPGTNPFIDFPLYQSGSIDGTVRDAQGEPMTGMVVQLLDPNGRFLQEVPTLFDGFYTFELLRPGTYIVQVSPSHQVNVPPRTVAVTSEDPFAYGVDLFLLEQASEDSATDLTVVRDGGRVAHTYHAPVADGTLQPAPYSFDGHFDNAVSSVRIGEYPHKVRLVLDLSAPSVYNISSENEGHTISIDLPSTAWDATREWNFSKHPIFESANVYSINKGTGTRLQLKARQPLEVFYNTTLPPTLGKGHRLYVDFIEKK